MSANKSKNRLIILFNLSGSYKGGAQRRYLALFNYLQQINSNEYYLLLNDYLYEECMNNHLLKDSKNILSVSIKYGRVKPALENDRITNFNNSLLGAIRKKSKLYILLGSISSFFKQFKSWTNYSLKLIKIIRSYNIGTIYAIFTGGIWSWQIAKLMNVRFIYSYNDSAAGMIESNILKIFSSEYYPLKFSDKVDFLSAGILYKLREKGVRFNENRALFSPNSFILYDNYYPEYPKKRWIVFSARLTKIKNPALLLEAISILKNRNINDFEAHFLGEGILLPELLKLKTEYKLENVFFTGGISDTYNYLKKSSIFISIQNDNNYPSQSLLEAMACENAIIASDVGETSRIVTENEGILVQLNALKIADALSKLLSDPIECHRLGKNAREKVLKEHNIEKYVEFFLGITKA